MDKGARNSGPPRQLLSYTENTSPSGNYGTENSKMISPAYQPITSTDFYGPGGILDRIHQLANTHENANFNNYKRKKCETISKVNSIREVMRGIDRELKDFKLNSNTAFTSMYDYDDNSDCPEETCDYDNNSDCTDETCDDYNNNDCTVTCNDNKNNNNNNSPEETCDNEDNSGYTGQINATSSTESTSLLSYADWPSLGPSTQSQEMHRVLKTDDAFKTGPARNKTSSHNGKSFQDKEPYLAENKPTSQNCHVFHGKECANLIPNTTRSRKDHVQCTEVISPLNNILSNEDQVSSSTGTISLQNEKSDGESNWGLFRDERDVANYVNNNTQLVSQFIASVDCIVKGRYTMTDVEECNANAEAVPNLDPTVIQLLQLLSKWESLTSVSKASSTIINDKNKDLSETPSIVHNSRALKVKDENIGRNQHCEDNVDAPGIETSVDVLRKIKNIPHSPATEETSTRDLDERQKIMQQNIVERLEFVTSTLKYMTKGEIIETRLGNPLSKCSIDEPMSPWCMEDSLFSFDTHINDNYSETLANSNKDCDSYISVDITKADDIAQTVERNCYATVSMDPNDEPNEDDWDFSYEDVIKFVREKMCDSATEEPRVMPIWPPLHRSIWSKTDADSITSQKQKTPPVPHKPDAKDTEKDTCIIDIEMPYGSYRARALGLYTTQRSPDKYSNEEAADWPWRDSNMDRSNEAIEASGIIEKSVTFANEDPVSYASTLKDTVPVTGDDRHVKLECRRFISVDTLSPFTTEGTLLKYFKKFGTVLNHMILRGKTTKLPMLRGVVEFQSAESVERVLEKEPHWLDGKVIVTMPLEDGHYFDVNAGDVTQVIENQPRRTPGCVTLGDFMDSRTLSAVQ